MFTGPTGDAVNVVVNVTVAVLPDQLGANVCETPSPELVGAALGL
jgi:hypothetical protein